MDTADLILKFDIAPGQSPEVESVVRALSAWVGVLQAAASVVEPESPLVVELVGVEAGSQMFKLALKRAEQHAQRLKDGAAEYPLISKAAITLGGLIGGAIAMVAITNAMTPDPRIPEDQMQVFNEISQKLEESVDLQRKSMEFYGILQDEPAFDRIKVLRGYDGGQIYQVPRSEFGARSGLWSGDAEQVVPTTEQRTAVWDVILIKPVSVAKERRWTFAKDGIEFSALMTDKAVLEAIHDKTLPIQIAEGVAMKIEVQWREKFNGKVWLPVSGSHRVKRVIHPIPPLTSGLFAAPSSP